MSYTNQTVHYGLPLPTQTDLVNGLDTNDAFERIDSAIYGAQEAANAATNDITTIKSDITSLENNVVRIGTDVTDVKAHVSTLEQNQGTVVEDIQDTQDMITAREVASAQSDQRILVGEWFRYNGVLYKCTAQINVDDTIVPNVNCVATNIEAEMSNGGTVSVDAADVYYTDTVTQLGAANVQAAIVALKSLIDSKEAKKMKSKFTTHASGTSVTINLSSMGVSVASADDYYVIINGSDIASGNSVTTQRGGRLLGKTATSFTVDLYSESTIQVVYSI